MMQYFFAQTAATLEWQLYVTDGTAAGTVALAPGFANPPGNPTMSGGVFYFTATDGTGGTEVWASTGAAAVKLDPNPDASSDTYSVAGPLTPFTTMIGATATDAVAFVGKLASGVYQVYVTTGTSGSGTEPVGPTFTAAPTNFVVSGNIVYFTAVDATGGTEVWATNGGSAARLDPIANGSTDTYQFAGSLTPFTESGGTGAVAFIGQLATGFQLYVSTGEGGPGTVAVGPVFTAPPANFVVSGNTVYFTAFDATGSEEVWATTGTSAVKLDPVANASTDSYTVVPSSLTPFTELSGTTATTALAFVGQLPSGLYQLYVTTGTAGSGTAAVGPTFSAPPGNFVVSGNTVYFTAVDGTGGTEVWATTGTSAVKLDPIASAASDTYQFVGGSLTPFTEVSGATATSALAFVGQLPGGLYQVYVTTGTSGTGTVAVGPAFSAAPANFVVSGNTVYFTATDGTGGTEAWATTGTAAVKLDPIANASSDTYTVVPSTLTPFTDVSGTTATSALAFVGQLGSGLYPGLRHNRHSRLRHGGRRADFQRGARQLHLQRQHHLFHGDRWHRWHGGLVDGRHHGGQARSEPERGGRHILDANPVFDSRHLRHRRDQYRHRARNIGHHAVHVHGV